MYVFRSLVWKGILYRRGDKVIVHSGLDNTNHYWKAVIQNFYIQECEGKIGVFFEAHYYPQILRDDDPLLHSQFDMTIVGHIPREYSRNNIRQVSLIQHKFILLPAVGNDEWKA